MKTPGKPNVVLIIADDQRYDTVHAFGNEDIQTPVLDSLVERGVSFSHTYITGGLTPAVCVPGRACINTGTHTLHASQDTQLNHWPDLMTINPRLSLLPHVFRQEGYHTFATGKWHNDRQSFIKSFSDGAKIFFGGMSDHHHVPVYDFDPNGTYPKEKRYNGEQFSTDMFTGAAVQFIREYQKEDPFFLYLALTSPHDPREAPKEYAELYDPEQIPLPNNFMDEHPFDNGEMNVRDEQLAPRPRTPESVRGHIADYYAMVTHMDNRVGDVINALRDRGELENTIIVFTSDHGLAVGQHGLMGKQSLYEHSTRIPLIMTGPGLPRGKQVHGLTCQFDIFPTLCDLVDIPIPQTVEGQSLLPFIHGEKDRVHSSVFAVYKDLQRMVSDGEWKLIRYYRPEEHNYGTDRIQLFNLKDDPWETTDLSADPHYLEHLQRLASELAGWQQSVQDPWAYRSVLPAASSSKNEVWGNWND